MRRGLMALVALLAVSLLEVHVRDAHAQAASSAALSVWAVFHQPVAATQATISKAAAGTTVKHVATSLTVCISAATGAGTVLWTARLAAPTVGDSKCVVSPPLYIIGSSNTAMTLESAAAPAATNFATVSLSGYDTL